MSVRIFVVTHDDIGQSLVETVTKTFGQLPLQTTVISIDFHTNLDEKLNQLQASIEAITKEDPVLVLADMFGSTPCNLAQRLRLSNQVMLITGVNLPMLVRVMNYPNLPLEELAEKAVSGGREGVINC